MMMKGAIASENHANISALCESRHNARINTVYRIYAFVRTYNTNIRLYV